MDYASQDHQLLNLKTHSNASDTDEEYRDVSETTIELLDPNQHIMDTLPKPATANNTTRKLEQGVIASQKNTVREVSFEKRMQTQQPMVTK